MRSGTRPYFSRPATLDRPGGGAMAGRLTTIALLRRSGARVLEGVAAGASTAELAAALHLSPQGVEYHVAALLRRLHAANRPALVARAYALRVLDDGQWPPRVAPDAVRDSGPRPGARG
ncbi:MULTISPECIES: response regulator transcription factor [unclassified Solwaraspora]|uniref:response regulator transcription factor n=1 Tax=unclassified Solwaraspora TaxID=2627926 RepID=UPI00259BB24C|nr:LuxR C-terminal-related transcriptional regulator [Solwaraspora sp. WMMA2056]WJK38785.1 LuxR C-terminal-related transcriptional regulator [Solwaraspora sp. WMMA2056]